MQEMAIISGSPFKARKSSKCHTCLQEIEPDTMIVRHRAPLALPYRDESGQVKVRYIDGAYSHEGCVWKGHDAPWLTWRQLEAIKRIQFDGRLPKGDIDIIRFYGAINKEWMRLRFKSPTEDQIVLELGTEMLTTYNRILARVESAGHQVGNWHQPKDIHGNPWRDPRDPDSRPKTQEEAPVLSAEEIQARRRAESQRQLQASIAHKKALDARRVAAGLPSMFATPVIRGANEPPTIGYIARGRQRITVEVQGYSGNSTYIRPAGTNQPFAPWNGPVFDTPEEADADIQEFLNRSSRAVR